MGVAWIGRLSAAFALVGVVGLARADDRLPPLPGTAKSSPTPPPPSATDAEAKPADLDVPAVRAKTLERLKTLPKPDDKTATAASKALAKLLEERSVLLNEWDKAVKDRQAAENPVPSPEKLAADAKADLSQVQGLLDRGAKDPDVFLPASLQPAKGATATRPVDLAESDLKEAIDAAQADLKDWSTRLEQAKGEGTAKDALTPAAARASRDKTFKQLTLLKSRKPADDDAPAATKTPEALECSREAAVNLEWEIRVEAERLRAREAEVALATRRAELTPVHVQVLAAHVKLAETTLDRLKVRYQILADRRQRDLRAKAVKEERIAKQSNDPVERYRAKRSAELSDEEALLSKSASMLATDPPPSLEEQRRLADGAFTDFTEVKHLLDDGEVSHLDALRLTNDFRRIGVERARITSHELAAAAARLTLAENALSGVELELVNDGRDDRYELDGLLERLPPSRQQEAMAVYKDLEAKHFKILNGRRANLIQLASRAQETHDQVERRLQILNDHFGFIKTHIFWVRDEEPIGEGTAVQLRREAGQLARCWRMVADLGDRGAWGWVSAEFVVAAVGLVVLPWPLHRARRLFRRYLTVCPAPTPAVAALSTPN